MASVTSAATTIFDNNVEPRFEELRTARKAITAAVNYFVNEWRSVSSIPRDQWDSDDDVFDRVQDVDAKRQEIAINVKHWISMAHGSLDVHNEGDQVMLLKMAGYVDRVRKHLADHPFLNVSDAGAEERARLPEKGDILKPKEVSHGHKRAFGDVSLLPSMQPSKLLRQKNPLINISDDDYEDTQSEMQITPNVPPPLNYVPAYLEEPSPAAVQPPTARQPRASLSGALNKRPRSISPNQAAKRAEIQAEADALAKNMQMLKEAQAFAQQQQEEKTKMLREMEVMRKQLATREREAAERRQQEVEEKERVARLEAQEARRQAQAAKAKAVEEEMRTLSATIKASATEMQQMREILTGNAPLDPAPEATEDDTAAAADLFQFPKRRRRPSPKMPVVQHQQQQRHQPSDDVGIEMEIDVGTPTALSHPNIPVAHIGSSAIEAEAGLRQRQLAAQHAKEARPAKKFSTGSSLEYRNVMARFDMAVKSPGMDSRMKLLEMMHWFAGNAGDVVDCYAASRDSDLAYATVRSELDSLYGATSDSVVPLIRQLASGKAISEFDHDGHLTLYTRLIFAEATAREVGQMDQLNRRDNIADIAENRVKHIAKKVWELDAKLKRKHGRHINFADFKGIVHEWVGILSTRKTLMAPPAVKVNVTEVVNAPTKSQTSRQIRKEKESFSSAVKEGVKRQQPSSKCNFCGSVHATEDCATFANLSVDERVKKIQQMRLCFHCFESGHISRNCDAKPTCLKCQKRHHTLLHGQKPPSTLNTHVNAQASTLNADAAAFQGRTGSTESPANRGAASLIPVPPLNSVVDESTANPGNLLLA